MVFFNQTYSVLLVSSMEKWNSVLMELLPASLYYPVKVVKTAGHARRCLLEQAYDMVIVNTPLPDDFGLQLAMDASRNSHAGVLMLVKGELFEEIEDKAVVCGVISLSKPTSRQMLEQHLRILRAIRERMRVSQRQQMTLEETIQEIRLINRAKWLLIRCRGMTEEEAHRYIEKQAMDQRISKGAVAKKLLDEEQ